MRGFYNNKMWCHLSSESGERYTNRQIRQSEPTKAASFWGLVPFVARIANHNPDFGLFFRGQANDFKLKSGLSSFYPTIFRNSGQRLSEGSLKKRFDKLDHCSKLLLTKLDSLKIDGIVKLKKFPELQWSILQHYGVCDTPLLDLTHSLRVAASFALNAASEKAYVFVFALPYPQGTITYSTEDELLNIRLLSASPSEALRPHFQEGYLVGTFPARVDRKHPSFDLGVRLIAKIELETKDFWGENFHAIPYEALYPRKDTIAEVCQGIQ